MKNFILCLLLLAGFASCSNDDVASQPEEQSLYFHLTQENGNDGGVKSESASVSNGATIAFTDGHLYLVNQGGAILDKYTLSATQNTNLANKIIKMSDATAGGGCTITNIPGATVKIYVFGNVPSSVTMPVTGQISAVKALTVAQTGQEISGCNLYGEGTLTDPVAPVTSYTCTVNLKPTIARIEIPDITADGDITGFKVTGIFLDKFYTTATLDGSTLTTLHDAGIVSANYGDNTTQYPSASKGKTYDIKTGGYSTTSKVAKPDGSNVWGYNVFAKLGSPENTPLPSIVIKLKDITTTSGSTYSNPRYVTIRGLKEGGTEMTAISPGKVYKIGGGVLKIDETMLAPNPNQQTINVVVTISVATWTAVNITPVI